MCIRDRAYKDHEKYLARSLEVAATLETMVQELLTISRLEPNVDFKMEHFDCAPMIHGYLREIDDLVATKELQIHLAIQLSLIHISMTTLVRDAVTTRSAKERKNSAGRSSGR